MAKETPRRRLELKLQGAARARGLWRIGGGDDRLFEQVPGCPCAYRAAAACDDFVRRSLIDDEDYRSDPRLPRALSRYLRESDEALPRLARDERILSFSNGVYVLAEDRFVPYGGGGDSGLVAGHHIAAPFTGSTDAPLFESLLAPQFEADGRKERLCALVGRLLFRRPARDSWQVTQRLSAPLMPQMHKPTRWGLYPLAGDAVARRQGRQRKVDGAEGGRGHGRPPRRVRGGVGGRGEGDGRRGA